MAKSSRRGRDPETLHRPEPGGAHVPGDDDPNKAGPGAPGQGPGILHEATWLLLKTYTPSGVVVNDAMEVVQSFGQGRPQFMPVPGGPACNLLAQLKGRLATQVRVAVAAARQSRAAVKRRGTHSRRGFVREFEIEVIPLGDPGRQGHFLILFHERPASVANLKEPKTPAAQDPAGPDGQGPADQEIERL